MPYQMIHDNNGKSISYESLLVEPQKLSIFSSELCLKIVEELVKEPACAMDLARRLGQHEQKIYYHIRRLEEAGIIKQIKTEKRYSMTAKIYGVVAPIIATKLYEDGHTMSKKAAPVFNPSVKKFFHPFITDNRLNAKIIVGDPYPHGRHNKPSRSAVHATDFLLWMGNMVTELKFPHYKLDVDTREEDLKDNLILLGNSTANTIVDKLNAKGVLPVFFDQKNSWALKSRSTGKLYDEASMGVIMKIDNPFAPDKKILVISGIRTRGMQAAMIALTKRFDDVIKAIDGSGNVARVVEGLDESGDRIIDNVNFLE